MSTKKFCPTCGSKVDDNLDFCSNCGSKLNKKNNNSNAKVNTQPHQTKNNISNKSHNSSTIKKLAILVIIVIIAIIAVSSLGGIFNNDIVDVTSIEMTIGTYDTPFGKEQDSALVSYSLMPRETITRMTGLVVSNVEVTLENGEKENWGSFSYTPKNKYLKDSNYKFTLSKTLENKEDYYTISHIRADIVMNTTDEKNVVIGHIDNDITPKHD